MKNIGLFEAKTKLSEICEQVMKNKEPVLITKRGKPLVRIDPVENESSSVWDLSNKFRKTNKNMDVDFELPERSVDADKNHLG